MKSEVKTVLLSDTSIIKRAPISISLILRLNFTHEDKLNDLDQQKS